MGDVQHADFLVIGGGIAGLSIGDAVAGLGSVIVLEAEDAIGYHSSGRSATCFHYGMALHETRALTAASERFFRDPPDGFSDVPLAKPFPALFVVREGEEGTLSAYRQGIARLGKETRCLNLEEIAELAPNLKLGNGGMFAGLLDPHGMRIDSDALLQSYARRLRGQGGVIRFGERIERLQQLNGAWQATTARSRFEAPIVINAAGAWVDAVATMAGVEPLGFAPLRRSIISFPAPDGVDISDWPFVRSLTDEFYFLPEAGLILASSADEIPSPPCDAAPEEYDVALAAHQIEQATTLTVGRIEHKWAGLRTFAPDRIPVVGFDANAPGFFWFAGQGGSGLQTGPALAKCAHALIAGSEWPQFLTKHDVSPCSLGPERKFAEINLGDQTCDKAVPLNIS